MYESLYIHVSVLAESATVISFLLQSSGTLPLLLSLSLCSYQLNIYGYRSPYAAAVSCSRKAFELASC